MKNTYKFNNPLSYSQNSRQATADLARKALRQLGTPENKQQRFDSFSTIQIDLDGRLAINLAVEDDRLWLWTLLRCNEYQLFGNRKAVLSALTGIMPGVESGTLTLGKSNEGYVLKALLNLNFTAQENGLSTIIYEFHKHVQAISRCGAMS